MLFSGGVRGFFLDLYCGAVEKGYKLTHPELWELEQGKAEDSGIDGEELIEALQTLGVEDEELFTLLEEMEDMTELSEEEVQEMIQRLKEKNITFDLSVLVDALEEHLEQRREDREIPEPVKASAGEERQASNLEDWVELYRIVNKKRNQFDPLPEEQGNYSPDEITEIIRRVKRIMKQADDV